MTQQIDLLPDEPESPVVEFRHVSKRFGGVVALDDVSLKVRRGELLAICGENGAGKSTLMKILSGQHTEYEGEIFVRGELVRFQGIKDAENAGISIIHQELNLVDELTVAANMFLGREESRWGFLASRTMNQRAAELLSQLQCDISPQTRAGKLRVGDQQLVEIAKAVGLGAEIMIMDEPTSALTESEVARLDRVINDLRRQNVTILYISHKMDEIFRLSDRVTVLRDGKHIDTVVTSQSQPREVAQLMVGREFAAIESDLPAKKDKYEKPILSVRELWRDWPGHARRWRLRDISFDLYPGEIVGIAGLMGAGRTELLECIFGCSEDAFGGEIRLDGEEYSIHHPRQAIEAGIAMVTEDRKRLGLFQNLNARSNISMCALQKARVGGLISRSKEHRACQRTIDQLHIKLANQTAPIGSLSGGNQQKCVIGRALLTEPRVLLLDDPTRGIDVGAKAEIYKLLGDLANQGLGILMTSSELPELLMVCHRMLVLCEGRMTGKFTAEEATEHKVMEAATAIAD